MIANLTYPVIGKPKRLLDWAFEQGRKGLGSNSLLVLLVMCRRANQTLVCFMSQERISVEAGIGVSTVFRAQKELRAKGLIIPIKKRTPRGMLYFKFAYESDTDCGQIDRSRPVKERTKFGQADRQNQNESKIESFASSPATSITRNRRPIPIGDLLQRKLSEVQLQERALDSLAASIGHPRSGEGAQ